MKNISVVFACICFCLISAKADAVRCIAHAKESCINPNGRTVIVGSLDESPVEVTLLTHELDAASTAENPICTQSRIRCSLLSALEINVNGHPLLIPHSVYSDLSDLVVGELRSGHGAELLILKGGDAAGSYLVTISFNSKAVKERALEDGEMKELLQKTEYFQPIPTD